MRKIMLILLVICTFVSCGKKEEKICNTLGIQSKVREYVALGRDQDALDYLDSCIKDFPREYSLYMIKGMVLSKEKESEEEKENFKKSVELLDSIIDNGGTDHTFFSSRAIAKVFLKDTTAYEELLANRKYFDSIITTPIGQAAVDTFFYFILTKNEETLRNATIEKFVDCISIEN